MEVNVKVHPRSRGIKVICGDVMDVYLTEPAEDNRANIQLLDVLKREFGCDARLIRGYKSKRKMVSLDLSEGDFNALCKKRPDGTHAHKTHH